MNPITKQYKIFVRTFDNKISVRVFGEVSKKVVVPNRNSSAKIVQLETL